MKGILQACSFAKCPPASTWCLLSTLQAKVEAARATKYQKAGKNTQDGNKGLYKFNDQNGGKLTTNQVNKSRTTTQNAATSGFEVCFAPSILGAEAKKHGSNPAHHLLH